QHQKPEKQRAFFDIDYAMAVAMPVIMIEFRQQMQQRETEQKGAGEGIEELYVPGFVQLEREHRDNAERDARKQKEIVHTRGTGLPDDSTKPVVLQIVCNTTAKKNPAMKLRGRKLLHQQHLPRALDRLVQAALIVCW